MLIPDACHIRHLSHNHWQLNQLRKITRWHPRGIQQLVSTYELHETPGGWGGGYSQTSSMKCAGEGGVPSRPTQTQSAKICPNFILGGGGTFEPNFQPLQLATASHIVSHILRMWRLINDHVRTSHGFLG